MREALALCDVVGPKSNVSFLERLVRHPAVVEARIDTGYLDRHLDEFLAGHAAPSSTSLFAAATVMMLDQERVAAREARSNADPHSPWALADGWRIGHPGKRIVVLECRGERYEIEARGHDGDYRLRHADTQAEIRRARFDSGWLSAHFEGEARRVQIACDETCIGVHLDGGVREVFVRGAAFAFESASSAGGDRVLAPMPGRVVMLKAKPGDAVQKDQELLVMEAMKMELTLRAPRAGTIQSVNASAGEFVEADAVLLAFDPQKSG